MRSFGAFAGLLSPLRPQEPRLGCAEVLNSSQPPAAAMETGISPVQEVQRRGLIESFYFHKNMTQYLREKACFSKLPLAACVLFKHLIPFNPFLLTINCATNRTMIAALPVHLVAVGTSSPTSIKPVWLSGENGAPQLCCVNRGQISGLFGSQDYNPFLSRAFPMKRTAYQLARQEGRRTEHNPVSFEQPRLLSPLFISLLSLESP